MLGQRGPPSFLQSSCWGQLRACIGWMVQGMSGIWFHLQPNSEGPLLFSTLLPMARSIWSWQAEHQEHSIPLWTEEVGDAQHPWECLVATVVSPPLSKQRASVQVPRLLPLGWQISLP